MTSLVTLFFIVCLILSGISIGLMSKVFLRLMKENKDEKSLYND